MGSGLYFGLLRVPTRHLFRVTTWMISLLAAGMAAQAMTFLAAAGVLNLGSVLWDSSGLLSESSVVGRILHTLIGYMDRPTEAQAVSYMLTLAVILGATRFAGRRLIRARA